MSFGSPTPIEVAVASPNLANAKGHALRSRVSWNRTPICGTLDFVNRSITPPCRYKSIANVLD